MLVNNAGGAIGVDPVERANPDDWQWMYDVNVIGVLRVTQALMPALEAGPAGTSSSCPRPPGAWSTRVAAGYTAAKHAATAVAETLRLELNGRPIRVSEIAPGHGPHRRVRAQPDARRRGRRRGALRGVAEPLVAEDIADCVAWVVTRPPHVDIDLIVVKPLAQAAAHKVHRVD